MKKLILIAVICTLTFSVNAQITTPQPSTSQTVIQTVGLTSLELTYSRPSMREREIFGVLVPYGKCGGQVLIKILRLVLIRM